MRIFKNMFQSRTEKLEIKKYRIRKNTKLTRKQKKELIQTADILLATQREKTIMAKAVLYAMILICAAVYAVYGIYSIYTNISC